MTSACKRLAKIIGGTDARLKSGHGKLGENQV